VLLEAVADFEIAELRRVAVPADRVTAGPVAAGRGADLDRHRDAGAGVEARAAYLRQIPSGPEIARAPFRVRLESARGEHDRFCRDALRRAAAAQFESVHAFVVGEKARRARSVPDFRALALRGPREVVDEARSSPPGFHGEAAPEAHAIPRLERLTAVHRREAHALLPHPAQRVEAALDQ